MSSRRSTTRRTNAAALVQPSSQEVTGDEAAAMFARWHRAVTPARSHGLLAYFEGEWQTETHLFANGPSASPIVSTGEAFGERIFDGRFVQLLQQGSLAVPAAPGAMDIVEIQGLHTLGFDTYRNLYVGTWIDSLSTALIALSGTLCEEGVPTLTLFGQQDEPMLGIVGRTVKFVYRLHDDERFDFELHDQVTCGESLILRIAFQRNSSEPDQE